MSLKLKLDNFSSNNITEPTNIDADVVASASPVSILVDDSQNFVANDYVIVGPLGSETGELKQLSSVADATHITVPSLSFNHNRFDKITKLFGNKLRIYRAPNVNGTQPADSVFTSNLLTTIDIDPDQVSTSYIDSSGSSSWWYKYTYYNSTSTAESDLADSPAVRGGSAGNYASIDSIRNEAGLSRNTWISDAQIDEKRQAAQSLINSTLSGLYNIPFADPVNPLIAEITRKLAAGYLLTDDYGPAQSLDTRQGQQKIDYVTNDKGTGVLDRLNTKKLVLVGLLGEDDSITPSGAFSMWPDATTGLDLTDPDNGAPRMFSTQQRY